MKLVDKLRTLLSHQVMVELATEASSKRIDDCTLDGVGDDFIAVRIWDGGHGFPNRDEDMWYIPLKNVIAIVHPTTCTWCGEQVHFKTAGRQPIISRLAGVILRAKRNPRYL